MKWNNVANLSTLPMQEDHEQENYFYSAGVLPVSGDKLGFHLDELAPGNFSCPYHFHHGEEELFLVVEGRAMLRQNGEFRELVPNDLVFFRTGPEGVHQFYNHTDKPFRYLAISSKDDAEVCEYPDSNKTYVRKIQKVFKLGDAVKYIHGEEDPAQYWPAELLRPKK